MYNYSEFMDLSYTAIKYLEMLDGRFIIIWDSLAGQIHGFAYRTGSQALWLRTNNVDYYEPSHTKTNVRLVSGLSMLV